MNIVILGYGNQGRSAYEYWNKSENTVTVCDQNIVESVPKDAETNFGGDYLMDLERFDLIVRSPSLHPSDILASNPDHPEIMSRITTVTNEFFKVCPSRNIIGVTGTKGKGTTSSLISKLLEKAGHTVHLGGNIGIPPLDMLKKDIAPEDWVILELANFQLIDLQHSPKIGVCLMVSAEHLDWHKDMYEYITAKQQMFIHQLRDDLAVYNARNLYSEEVATVSHSQKVTYDVPPIDGEINDDSGVYVDGDNIIAFGKKVCDINDIALLGRHNIENVCAAIAATWEIIKGDTSIIKKVIRTFPGLPHRLEIVKDVKGIWYINDSFASHPSATIAAINAIEKPKVLIIGGFNRDIDLSNLASKISTDTTIKKVVAIGETRNKIAKALDKQNFKNYISTDANTMIDIIKEAQIHANKGDAILFSPGFASFDMFKNFEDRGIQFKQCVEKL